MDARDRRARHGRALALQGRLVGGGPDRPAPRPRLRGRRGQSGRGRRGPRARENAAEAVRGVVAQRDQRLAARDPLVEGIHRDDPARAPGQARLRVPAGRTDPRLVARRDGPRRGVPDPYGRGIKMRPGADQRPRGPAVVRTTERRRRLDRDRRRRATAVRMAADGAAPVDAVQAAGVLQGRVARVRGPQTRAGGRDPAARVN
mmetsp:Transcript_25147/g.78455  ORF Transcript_25147/g.78455 Transcript_25147/m.78455 type:complete len:203 (-) Transcript_25147:19-627(-)